MTGERLLQLVVQPPACGTAVEAAIGGGGGRLLLFSVAWGGSISPPLWRTGAAVWRW